jgi:LysR family glycine cleavage system transcriptional activator
MGEEVFPVCSPAFLENHHGLRSPADLAGLTLIDDLSVDRQIGFVTWDAWLEAVGEKAIAARSGLTINNSAAVL